MIDFIFILLIIFAAFKGLRKGFVLAVFSFFSIIIGLAAAIKLSAIVASKLSASININERWLPFISFSLVMIAVIFLVKFIGGLIQRSLNIVALGFINKLAGFLLYAILYITSYSVILFYATRMQLIKPETITASASYSFIEPFGPKVIDVFAMVLPIFKDLFTQLENFFSSVAQKAATP